MSNYLEQIIEFIWAVIGNWAGYATGGIVIAFFWLWSTITRKAVPRRLGISLAFIFLFFAVFTAWRKEYLKTRPGLKLQIDGLGVGYSTKIGPTQTRAILWVSISNNGPPTIADDWELSIQMPQSTAVKGVPVEIDQSRPLVAMNSSERISIDPSDALYSKTLREPIAIGMKLVGVLVFDVPLSFEETDKKGTIYSVSCQDVHGNKVSQPWVKGSGRKGEYGYLPGMKQGP